MRAVSAHILFLATAAFSAIVLPAPPSAEAVIASHQQCSYCHNLHGAAGNVLLNQATVEAVCLSCHGPGGISVLKADVHSNSTRSKYPAFRISCGGCHDAHDNMTNWLIGTNIKLVGMDLAGTNAARISTPNSGVRDVVFENRGTTVGQPSLHSFADADQDGNGYYDGVCETCHTLTKYHRNSSSGGHKHNTGETCTASCHLHTNKFLK